MMILSCLCASVLLSTRPPPAPDPAEPPPAATGTPASSPDTTAAPPEDRVGPRWHSGEEPLGDYSVPPPGSLTPPLDIIERDPSNWLGIPPDKELLNYIRDPLKRLNAEYGLLINGAYTILYQQSIGPNPTNAGAGDFDLTGRWTFIGRGTKDEGSFYLAGEYRHQIGPIPPSQLGPEIGTLLGTANGFNDRGWAVKEAYYVQRLFDDHFRVGVGRIDPENLVGAHDLQSANTSFLNKAFSTNPTIAFPGSGFGAAASVRPVDWLYVSGGASNAYGNTTQITIDDLDQGDFFTFIEAGFTPEIEGIGNGKYRVAFWHMDSRPMSNLPADGGISVIIDQKIGKELSLFARYGYADGTLTSAKQSVQVGGGYQGLFGSTSDLTGLAVGWSQPEDHKALRSEKVVEIFHRMQLSGRVQFTVGFQTIFDPSRAPAVDALGVFSMRLRVTF